MSRFKLRNLVFFSHTIRFRSDLLNPNVQYIPNRRQYKNYEKFDKPAKASIYHVRQLCIPGATRSHQVSQLLTGKWSDVNEKGAFERIPFESKNLQCSDPRDRVFAQIMLQKDDDDYEEDHSIGIEP